MPSIGPQDRSHERIQRLPAGCSIARTALNGDQNAASTRRCSIRLSKFRNYANEHVCATELEPRRAA